MDLSFVTERILALSFPPEMDSMAYRDALHQASTMLQTKHGDNYMVIAFIRSFFVEFVFRNRSRKCPTIDKSTLEKSLDLALRRFD